MRVSTLVFAAQEAELLPAREALQSSPLTGILDAIAAIGMPSSDNSLGMTNPAADEDIDDLFESQAGPRPLPAIY